MTMPDLLKLEAQMTIDEKAMRETLSFAFATGKAPALLEGYLVNDHHQTDPQWQADHFEDDLFLDDFVKQNFRLHFFNTPTPLSYDYLKFLLANPPTNREEIYYRQEIMAELTRSDEHLQQLKALYVALRNLVWCFDTSSYGIRLDLSEFRMNVLSQLKSVMDRLGTSFKDATSGLNKLYYHGQYLKQTEAYKELADIIEYDDHLSKLDIQIRVGATGDLRGFRILKLQENTKNQYYSSPLRRVWEKLKLYARGYRFSDHDLMAKLTHEVFQKLEHHITPFVQLLAQIEFYLAGIAFRETCKAHGLETCLPHFTGNHHNALIYQDLFNPLLFEQNIRPKPCTLHPANARTITMVTGPNSGGKTRLLQAIGLTQLLGQSGLYAPVSNATLPIANGIFASLREVDGVKDDEGRLGTELKRIQTLFQRSAQGSMVLLDELCSGTNPSEGAEIVTLVLEMLQSLGTTTFITTHFLDYVRRLEIDPNFQGLEFLRVALDDNQLPTFQFVEGVASSSLAKRIAARLGITRDQLTHLIRNKVA